MVCSAVVGEQEVASWVDFGDGCPRNDTLKVYMCALITARRFAEHIVTGIAARVPLSPSNKPETEHLALHSFSQPVTFIKLGLHNASGQRPLCRLQRPYFADDPLDKKGGHCAGSSKPTTTFSFALVQKGVGALVQLVDLGASSDIRRERSRKFSFLVEARSRSLIVGDSYCHPGGPYLGLR